MLKGSLHANWGRVIQYDNSRDGNAVQVYLEETDSDTIVGVYGYRDRLIFQMLTPDGNIVEIARVHTSECEVILNHDSEGVYKL